MITDEMVETAWGRAYAIQTDCHIFHPTMRAALEAVAPLIIRDAMAEMAMELHAKGHQDIARVFAAYATTIEKVLRIGDP